MAFGAIVGALGSVLGGAMGKADPQAPQMKQYGDPQTLAWGAYGYDAPG